MQKSERYEIDVIISEKTNVQIGSKAIIRLAKSGRIAKFWLYFSRFSDLFSSIC